MLDRRWSEMSSQTVQTRTPQPGAGGSAQPCATVPLGRVQGCPLAARWRSARQRKGEKNI